MSYKELEGVSPRYAVALKIADTLMCLGIDVKRELNKTENCHELIGNGVLVKVFSPYKVIIDVNGMKQACRGEMEAKRFLIERMYK